MLTNFVQQFLETYTVIPTLRFSFLVSVKPTIKAILSSPFLIFKPQALSKIIFYNVWLAFGHDASEGRRAIKEKLITPNARGVVLDLGAGLGSTIEYLSRKAVTRYVAVEPNTLMHPHIKGTANEAGYFEEDGSLLILSCGAEDYKTIASAIGGLGTVDTIISVLTLCSVPNPETTIRNLVNRLLSPGGVFLFHEHVASGRRDIRFCQWFWTPIWKVFFDGCNLNRPTDMYIVDLPYWKANPIENQGEHGQMGLWSRPKEDEDALFSHQTGHFIKGS